MNDFEIKTFEKNNVLTQTVDEASTNPIFEQVSEFDNSYSDSRLKELTDEFENITVTDEDIESTTLTQTNVLEKTSVSFKAKLLLAASISIAVLLMFLCVYNIFRINAMSSSIQLLEGNIATESVILNSLQNDVSDLNNTNGLVNELQSNGYYELSDDDIVYVDTTNAAVVEEVSGSTNWFDGVCNFISNVFGG